MQTEAGEMSDAAKVEGRIESVLRDIDRLGERVSSVEGRASGTSALIEEKFGSLRAVILSEIKEQFRTLQNHIDEREALMRADMEQRQDERLAAWRDVEIPQAVTHDLARRRQLWMDRFHKWKWPVLFAVVVGLTVAGEGNVMQGVINFASVFGV